MGLITTHCCTKNESSDTPPDMKLKIQLQGDISNNLSSSLLDNRKRVSFSETMEQRNIYIENEKRYTETKYDDIKKNPFNEEENIEDNLFTNVSFEESDNKFVIEDNFHRQRSMLPKTYEEIDKIINGDLAYKSIDKKKIISIINEIANQSNRIDCIIPIKNETEIGFIILTEFFIFLYMNKSNEVEKKYHINEIDFTTLTRDGQELILHLIGGRTSVIKSTLIKLEKVAACLASSYLLCKKGGQINSRQLSVILIDESFDIVDKIETIANYVEYRDLFNNFIFMKFRKIEKDCDINFKYISIRLSYEGTMKSANAIITKTELYIMFYNKNKKQFELVYKLSLASITKLIPNLRSNRLKIYNKDTFKTNPLVLQSESFCVILSLIEEMTKTKQK